MGAIQAQDYPMAKWAIGIRLSHSTDLLIESALHKGEILRIHLLRPTWHFVSADDIYWMLELTAPQIRASVKFRQKWLGLGESLVTKSNKVMEKVLSREDHVTRDELVAELEKANIRTDEYRSGHLLLRAELDGLICSGPRSGKKQTYTLLAKRVPKRRTMSREESLQELARRYFCSRAPVTLQDFIWWSGLKSADARQGLESVKSDLVSEEIDGKTYWFPPACEAPVKRKHSVHLLPAYDEFLISYKDRSAMVPTGIQKEMISRNGYFKPVIVVDGRVAGSWMRATGHAGMAVKAEFHTAHSRVYKEFLTAAASEFGKFLGEKRKVVLHQL
jgi:hypothetical protein